MWSKYILPFRASLAMGLITCTVFSFNGRAESTVPKERRSEAFLYFSDVIKSLSQIGEANEHLATGTGTVKEARDGTLQNISMFASEINAAVQEVAKARVTILPYERNPNPQIRESAHGLASGYEALQGFYGRAQKVMQDLYGGDHPQPFHVEQFAKAFADVDFFGQKAREQIAKSCVDAASTLLEHPGKNTQGKLAISSEEREAMILDIHFSFPGTKGKRWGSETEIDEAIWKILRVLEESRAKDEVTETLKVR